MKTPLLPNEHIVSEVGGSRIGIAMITKGGKIILTNLRLLYEAGLIGAKLETEVSLQSIEGYRKSYATGVGQILPLPNAIDIITDQEVFKFQMNGRDNFLRHLSTVAPHAQSLPDEAYGASVVSVGTRVVSGVKNAVTSQPIPSSQQQQQQAYTPQAATPNICCPKCNAPISSTSKFCGECGQMLQLSCPSCGASIMPDNKFCGECGTKTNME